MQTVQTRSAPETKLPFSPGPDLYPWDTGVAVAEMQELLCAHGFSLRIDGDFGWRTELAVKRFQKQHGLYPDGVVSARTWGALKSAVQLGDRLLWQGKSGADVVELQRLLQHHGYPVRQTGIFDADTKRAVIDFQQHQTLISNGVVDTATRLRLHGSKSNPALST
jgi:peptidoglycan hydrolase-like protein with peptidoglycan-binding domain